MRARQGGQLTNALRRCSTGLILFDELEKKAHPSLLTSILLPLLGDGVVHDMNTGRTLHATNYIVIMTSNVGPSDSGARPVAHFRTPASSTDDFPREFMGRMDDTIVFSRLNPVAVRQVWRRQQSLLTERLRHAGRWDVAIESAVEDQLLDGLTLEIVTGARAVTRTFEKIIVDPCLRLLAGNDTKDGSLIVSPADGGKIPYRILPVSK